MADQGGRIIRRLLPFERNFTTLPNEWVRDANLSPRTLGILTILMSHKDGYSISISQLAKERGVSSELISAALRDLEMHGYIVRRVTRKGLADNWEITDPSGLSDPALLGYQGLREPVDNHLPEKPAPLTDLPEKPAGNLPEKPALKENQLRNRSLPSGTIERRRSPVDNWRCSHGHPCVGVSGSGVPFCALGCEPQAVAS